jgi:hypothetical protein
MRCFESQVLNDRAEKIALVKLACLDDLGLLLFCHFVTLFSL